MGFAFLKTARPILPFLGLLILSRGVGQDSTVSPLGSVTFPKSTLYVVSQGVRHPLKVEVADTPERWSRGLMLRKTLGEGMVFLFPYPTGGGFWMKNTLIPLSIAFFDRQGIILRILDMEPCKKEPCPVYYPGVLYQGALEVNQEWFSRRGIRPKDRVEGPALEFWPR
ncbi:MAG: DUF192 domain-containing protein [Thermaceae bacterium]